MAKRRRPSAALLMGAFSGSIAALAVLPMAIVLVAWDTNDAIQLAAEKAVVMAEMRAAAEVLERPDELFQRVEVATMVHIGGDGTQVVERGEPLTIPFAGSRFETLCQQGPGSYDLISLQGRRWAWSCAPDPTGHVLVGVEPATISLLFVVFVLFTLMAVVGLVTALVVLRVLAPLSRVSSALSRVRAGQRDVRLTATGLAELDDMIFQVNDTASAMEQREDAIMARIQVAQRVARLVAHEVRNPLQSIELLTSLIVSERDADERRITGDAIRKEIRDLDQVVTQLLQRSVGDDLSLEVRPSDLADLVDHVRRLHTAEARRRGIQLEFGALEDIQLHVDSALLGRSLENLVRNAFQHAKSHIRVDAERVEDGVDLWVEDDGPGVDPSVADRAFSANVSLTPGGSGLGLALVQAVADAHGGHARHEVSPLGGARFVLHLPLRPVVEPPGVQSAGSEEG